MSLSSIFARIVALIGAAAIVWRRMEGGPRVAAMGSAPTIPAAKPQGSLPTLKMPTAKGWTEGQTPVAAPGLKVNAFAAGLKHPRWIHALPNGDVLVAEALTVAGPIKTAFDYAMFATMQRAAAVGVSPNRITLLRDADGDGVAETRGAFLEGLNQPFGMALLGDTFYVGNTDGVVAFPYAAGASRITAPGRKLTEFKPGGHWTRSLLPSRDGQKLYVGVGSLSNIADEGMAVEEGRAAIYELDLASGKSRIFAGGLRNPVGLAWEPHERRAMDGGQRARRHRRRDAAGLSDLSARRRLLWLALLLLGTDGGRPRAARPGHGRNGDYAGLRAGRPHRFARPLLAARRHAAGFPRRHGHRAARFLEPQHAERLSGRLRALRERVPGRAAARHPDGLPGPGRAGVLWTAGRGDDRPRRLAAGGATMSAT